MCSRFARVDMGRNDEEPGNLGRAEKGVILPGFLGSAGHALLRPLHRVLLNKRSESCYPFRRGLLVESPPIRAPCGRGLGSSKEAWSSGSSHRMPGGPDTLVWRQTRSVWPHWDKEVGVWPFAGESATS